MSWLMEKTFYQIIRNDIKTYKNITRIANGQDDDYTTGFLINYPYLKRNVVWSQ